MGLEVWMGLEVELLATKLSNYGWALRWNCWPQNYLIMDGP
jgi:hypothetical protein